MGECLCLWATSNLQISSPVTHRHSSLKVQEDGYSLPHTAVMQTMDPALRAGCTIPQKPWGEGNFTLAGPLKTICRGRCGCVHAALRPPSISSSVTTLQMIAIVMQGTSLKGEAWKKSTRDSCAGPECQSGSSGSRSREWLLCFGCTTNSASLKS
jgi:hypothetical protein